MRSTRGLIIWLNIVYDKNGKFMNVKSRAKYAKFNLLTSENFLITFDDLERLGKGYGNEMKVRSQIGVR